MSKLTDLLFPAKQTPSQKRAAELAKADYRLLAGLIRVRKSRKMSQQDVADLLGISQPTVASFERYDSDPKLSTIRRYAHAVGAIVTHQVTPDDGQLVHLVDWSAATCSVSRVTLQSYSTTSVKRANYTVSAQEDFDLAC
jgi:transcriptional regulator with XRE-family HTH domain